MDANTTQQVLAPWGYEYLPTQDYVAAIWTYQLFMSIAFGGYIWDTIISFPRDCEFIFFRRFNYVTVIFVTNRITTLMTAISFWLFDTSTTCDCEALNKTYGVTEAFSILSSEALLLIRVWALFPKNIILLAFMTLLMFAGPLLDVPITYKAAVITLPGSRGCSFEETQSFGFVPYLFQAIFDLLCFLLCTYKLLVDNASSIRNITKRDSLMKITQEMLNGGFIYYIPNVIIQIVTIVFAASTNSEVQYITTLAADGIASAQSLRITRSLWKSGQDSKMQTKDFANPSLSNNGKETGDATLNFQTSPSLP